MSVNKQIYNRKNIIIAVIICGALIIFGTAILPGKPLSDKKIVHYKTIYAQEIPHTIQNIPAKKEKHDTTRTYSQNKGDGFKLPEDVRKSLGVANQRPGGDSKSSDQHKIPAGTPVEKGNSSGGKAMMAQQNASLIPSMPRLIYDVVPPDEKIFNGELQLSLKINQDGQVVDHRILSNSLDCTDCLNSIIQAAYKSKWEPAVVDGKKADYWVVKAYSFK